MKKTHFKIGLLAACLISVSSTASAQNCGVESCASGGCKCSKKHCDDKGLLELINNAASNFEGRLADMIPDRSRACMKSPGVKSQCDCNKCSGSSDFATYYTEVTPVAQPDFVHPPKPRIMAPPNSVDAVPAPKLRKREIVPPPDSRVNPFGDDPVESTRNLRPVPARPASYLRSNSNSGVEFDPQASNQQAMRSVLFSKAASKTISDSANGLAKTTSTRRAVPHSTEVNSQATEVNSQVNQTHFEPLPPEVIPASLSVPVTSLRSQNTAPAFPDPFVNPLRAQ